MKKVRVFLYIFVFICLLTGCSKNQKREAISDVNDLEGRRVGVALAWGPDYLLTGRDDLELIRYNTMASMVMALCYDRLDAIAVEKPYALYIMKSVGGCHIVEEPIKRANVNAYVAPSRPELLDEFNCFISEFKKTDTYEDIMDRFLNASVYEPEIIPVGSGKKIKVGVGSDNYPFSYINFDTGAYEGCEIELVKHFANAYGYEPEFIDGTYEACELGVSSGKLDMSFYGCSELYREDVELSGMATVSDGYFPMDIVFIEIEDPEKVKIQTVIDY